MVRMYDDNVHSFKATLRREDDISMIVKGMQVARRVCQIVSQLGILKRYKGTWR